MNLTKSEQIKQGLQKSFQSGKSGKVSTVCYGYRRTPEKQLEIDPKQARIIRKIFKMYRDGSSLVEITNKLEARRILSPTGKEAWNREAVNKLLGNEKYVGNVVLGKTIVSEGVQVRNEDSDTKIVLTDTHPPIITEKLFGAVQREKARRSAEYRNSHSSSSSR